MLQKLRDQTHGWVTKTIIGVICFIFIVWGLEKMITPGRHDQSKTFVTVNGEPITQRMFDRAVHAKELRLSQLKIPIDKKVLQNEIMNKLIKESVLSSYLKNSTMRVPDSELKLLITTMPAFQNNGVFEKKRFISVLRNMGITAMQFQESLKNDMISSQLKNAIVESSFYTQNQLDHIARLKEQKRDISWSVIDFAKIKNKQQVSSSEIDAYYKDHMKEFVSPEKVKVDYISVNKSDLSKTIKITEDELSTAYTAYVNDENEKLDPKFSLILLNIDEKHSKANQLKKANALVKKINSGASFFDVAHKYSEDKEKLGKSIPLTTIDTEPYGYLVHDIAKSLKPNEVSKPIEATEQVILVKRIDSGKADVKSLEQMRASLVTKLQNQKVPDVFEKTSQKLGDLAFENSNLKSVSEVLSLPVKTTDFFTKETQAGISKHKEFVKTAFSHEVLKNKLNSDLVNISSDEVVVMHLNEFIPHHQIAQDKVESKITDHIKTIKAKAFIKDDSKHWVDLLQNNSLKNRQKLESSLTWKEQKEANRTSKGVPKEVLQHAFSIPVTANQKGYGWVQLHSGDTAIIRVNNIVMPTKKAIKERKEKLAGIMPKLKGNTNYKEFESALKNRAKVKIVDSEWIE